MYIFSILGHQYPWSGLDPDWLSVISLKCWNRIRIKWIRIRNTSFLTPGSGSGMGKIRIRDKHPSVSESFLTVFWVKNTYILCCESRSGVFLTLGPGWKNSSKTLIKRAWPEKIRTRMFLAAEYFIGPFLTLITSVADPDPGSGPFLTPGSGIRNRFFPYPGYQTHIFEGLVTIFWVKSSTILWKLAQIFSSAFQKLNNLQFCEICDYKKRYGNKFFSTPLFCSCFEIRDPIYGMGKNQDPG